MELNRAIIERMKELAVEHNMTMHHIIQKEGLNQATISELMNGRTKHPKISTIQKFCDGLQMPMNHFFDDDRFR